MSDLTIGPPSLAMLLLISALAGTFDPRAGWIAMAVNSLIWLWLMPK